MTCPKCGKAMRRTGDGPIKVPHYMGHYAGHGAKHAMRGHPAMLVFAGGCMLFAKAGNWLLSSWSCPNCGHSS